MRCQVAVVLCCTVSIAVSTVSTKSPIESYYWKLYLQNSQMLEELRERYGQDNHLFPKRAHSTTLSTFGTVMSDAGDHDEESHCTSDKIIIERLINNYKSFRTPSENGVIVWIE
ncbi:hypothetical protein KIN20_007298, partial [Parelaphostrongylus tenuis]